MSGCKEVYRTALITLWLLWPLADCQNCLQFAWKIPTFFYNYITNQIVFTLKVLLFYSEGNPSSFYICIVRQVGLLVQQSSCQQGIPVLWLVWLKLNSQFGRTPRTHARVNNALIAESLQLCLHQTKTEKYISICFILHNLIRPESDMYEP